MPLMEDVPMREMDFSEKNLRNRWLGVNSIWRSIQGEMKPYVKRRLEYAMQGGVTAHIGFCILVRSTSCAPSTRR
jgi:hypothetical protein